MAAADALAQRSQQASLGRVLSEQSRGLPAATQQFRAPTVAHSGNDFAARKRLENMRTRASSITNNPRWGGRRNGQNPSEIAYLDA